LRLSFFIGAPVPRPQKVKPPLAEVPVKPSQPTPTANDPRQSQKQQEYLGQLNLNPRNHDKVKTEPKDVAVVSSPAENGNESDSTSSELRIASDANDPSSEEEYLPKVSKKRKRDSPKKSHCEKRRKSDSFADALKKAFVEKKDRRKSLFDGNEQIRESSKNEALKKIFVYKDKTEMSNFKRKDEFKKKKRKKSKHHDDDNIKKRKVEVMSVARDPLKLKVKWTPLSRPSCEIATSTKEEKKGLKDALKERLLKEEESKIDKERLLHLRAVRHKNATVNKDYIPSPPSLTISKVHAREQPGKTSLVESKPSLEIMLVKKEVGEKKTVENGALDLSEKPKALDLSEKSTRPKEVSPVEKCPNKSTQQSILQIAETLVNRKLSPSPDSKRNTEPSSAVVAMRDLKTLSDAAVNILMAAQSQQTQKKPPETGLKIPVFPQKRATPVPPVPNLHEIYPRGRGRPPTPVIKPGQNQNVRHIPDPLAILNRQNKMMQQVHRPDSSTSPGKSKLNPVPPLESIRKFPHPLEKKDLLVNKQPMMPAKSLNGLSSTSPVQMKISPGVMGVRRMDMSKNIESVAAGLTARATALIDAK